jgi:hypothetical protein
VSYNAAIKVKILPRFPSRVTADAGLGSTLDNGILNIGFDFPSLTPNSGVSSPENFETVIRNRVSGQYEVVTLNGIPTTTTSDVRTPRGDADYTILAADRVVALTAALTAPRTWTLPAASALTGGTRIKLVIEGAFLTATNFLTVNRAGADTINGGSAWVGTSGYVESEFVTDGISKWTVPLTESIQLAGAALSVPGRASNTAGAFADIAAGTDGHVLRRAGTALGFGTVATAGLADGALSADAAGRAKMADGFLSADATGRAKAADKFATNAKLDDMAEATIKGRAAGAGTGVPIDLTGAQARAVSSTLAFGEGTAVVANSTFHDFFLPAGCKKITVTVDGLSIDASGDIIVQIGDSGGPETSGYAGSWAFTGTASNEGDLSSGFSISGGAGGAGAAIYGSMDLDTHNSLSNTWAARGVMGFAATSTIASIVGGTKTLSGPIDRVRLTTVGGTAAFDNGTINVSYLYA